jgi:DNA-binding CsgD family transcriptional regulator
VHIPIVEEFVDRMAVKMGGHQGALPFEVARHELLATGAKVRKGAVETPDELTAPQAQIARLAADGLSNPEFGAQLFISARTVEWHLRKVFGKLGINSRRDLRRMFPSSVAS